MLHSFPKPLAIKSLIAGSLALTITACDTTTYQVSQNKNNPMNIIMVVADGMGPVYPTAYRYWQDDVNTDIVETTIFDQMYVGTSSTYPSTHKPKLPSEKTAPVSTRNPYVTDSAASATALATGFKTYNGAIGVDIDKNPLETVLERAKSLGKKTGIAVTSQIVHATPASYIAKNESRRNYNAIADHYFDSKTNEQFKVDVMFGGGTKYFQREDRNLVTEFKNAGYQYIDSFQKLNSLVPKKPVLGLFAEVALPAKIDASQPNQLKAMTQAAVKQLENDNGFFLLVEASQVDWGGHSNDVAYAMGEMADLAATMEYLNDYVKQHPDTLVVLTADHNTGGMSVATNGKYKWQPEFLDNLKMTPKSLAESLILGPKDQQYIESQLGFSLSESEFNYFSTIKLEQQAKAAELKLEDSKNNKQLVTRYYNYIKEIIDLRTNTGWTSSGHTGMDVPVYAVGNNANSFSGYQDNTDIANKIFGLLDK